MSHDFPEGQGRFWVIGGRWVDGERHLPWPRVVGPFGDYQAAQRSAKGLNVSAGPNVRYRVAADVPSQASLAAGLPFLEAGGV